MIFLWKICFLSAALSIPDICCAVSGSTPNTSNEVEARQLRSKSGDSSGLQPYLFDVFTNLTKKGTDYVLELFKRNTTDPKPPSFLDLLNEFSGMVMSLAAQHIHKPNRSCYPDVGCFYSHQNMSLPYGGPMAPEEVGTVFIFFNNESRKEAQLEGRNWTLANWTLESMKDPTKPLQVVTHGFTGDITTPWLMPLVEALLNNVNCNVIVVDWRLGAAGPNYFTAAANTPMIGAQISLLVQKIIKATNCTLTPANITLIGFSLGAHVMGFAGRHFYNATSMKLGRIAGLDPAGMLFQGTNVSLSRHDAGYVDVIHTNKGDLKAFRLGLEESIGHVDFYPNGGSNQPNCKGYPKIPLPSVGNKTTATDALTDILDSMACSHYRAPVLFTESLTNHDCNFTSYPCPGGWADFRNCSHMFKHNNTVKGLMGYYSFTRNGKGDQYLETNTTSPYCIPEGMEEATTTVSTLAKQAR